MSFSISESFGSNDNPMVANSCVPICAVENPIACEIRMSCCDHVSSIVTAEYSVDSYSSVQKRKYDKLLRT